MILPSPTAKSAVPLGVFWLACAAFGGGTVSHAQMYCTEPVTPLCAERPGDVQTPSQESLCMESLERFANDLQDYRACLAESAAEADAKLERTEELRDCLREEGFGDCRSLDR